MGISMCFFDVTAQDHFDKEYPPQGDGKYKTFIPGGDGKYKLYLPREDASSPYTAFIKSQSSEVYKLLRNKARKIHLDLLVDPVYPNFDAMVFGIRHVRSDVLSGGFPDVIYHNDPQDLNPGELLRIELFLRGENKDRDYQLLFIPSVFYLECILKSIREVNRLVEPSFKRNNKIHLNFFSADKEKKYNFPEDDKFFIYEKNCSEPMILPAI